MQPHSMCAVAAANLIWNRGLKNVEFCRFKVEYQTPKGTFKSNYYDCNIKLDDDKRFNITTKRSGGGLACTLDVKIDSNNLIEMSHRIQHVAGLLERYTLEKNEIKGGHHRNSMLYRVFEGQIKYDFVLQLRCEVLHLQRKEFVKMDYKVTIDSIRYKK